MFYLTIVKKNMSLSLLAGRTVVFNFYPLQILYFVHFQEIIKYVGAQGSNKQDKTNKSQVFIEK